MLLPAVCFMYDSLWFALPGSIMQCPSTPCLSRMLPVFVNYLFFFFLSYSNVDVPGLGTRPHGLTEVQTDLENVWPSRIFSSSTCLCACFFPSKLATLFPSFPWQNCWIQRDNTAGRRQFESLYLSKKDTWSFQHSWSPGEMRHCIRVSATA